MELPINITTLILSSVVTAIITLVAYVLLKNLKVSRYDREKQRAELESIRKSLEYKMYEINDRLMMNENRWKDINHLILDSTKNESDSINENKVSLTRFLVNNGITKESLKVDNQYVFVLTPFNDRFFTEYDNVKKICSEVGFKCSRGDEEYFNSDIFQHILRQIVKARIIIANLNGRNANVLYELGIAQALDKSIILISKSGVELPIDVRTRKFIIYDTPEDLEKKLKNELIRILNTTPNKL